MSLTRLNPMLDLSQAHTSMLRNVTLVVNPARHSAKGWVDAALPDDYCDFEVSLHMDPGRVRRSVGVPDADQE
jgi:hypothetical protein